jgi:hypothetical protein
MEFFALEAFEKLIKNSAKQLNVHIFHLFSLHAIMLKCRFLKNGVLVKHKLISQLILLFLDFDGLRRFELGLVFGHVFGLFVITFLFHFVNKIAKL